MAESKVAVYGAMAANVCIAVTKFAVAGLTGSSAMLAEGFHSVVDTGNSALLLVGIKLSSRKPTAEHPFGHGKELYFWSLIVAVLIFGIGGGLSAYEGIRHMMHPNPLEDAMWNYIVLAAAAVFESISFGIALKQFMQAKGDKPFWRALRTSKDPTVYTILAEDSAALAGLAIAAAGVYASHRLNLPVLDGAASLAIGLLLAVVAIVLVRASRGLLIGEGVSAEAATAIRELALRHPCVREAAQPLSMYFGPNEVLLTLDVQFTPEAEASKIAKAVREIERDIRRQYPKITRIYIEAGAFDKAAA
jgi:cation diffusion facilitator family transporter